MKFRFCLAVLALSALAGRGPLIVQSPGQGLSPVNAVSVGEDEHLMLAGHDVVNYFTDGIHAMGSAEHKTVHKGVTFWFASAEHKSMFDGDPARYMPQFGGYCTNGIAYAIPWGGSADTWKIIDGKLYIFGGQGSMDAFMLERDKNLQLASQYWQDEVANSNAFWQRGKRLIFKVDHYKSGEELARMVAESRR